ncbi:DNA polymerase [Paracoccus sp. WLY502]|uniref:DNA polymerase n=1 Tax=Paracoccus yibinensis TaxID=3068891 RepID=UPI00279649AB|nr:DNA polymerase [Paracoccus sp. WLY502]MDQ1902074.1 DNA polymerase [Paracoccus sp. WLY502]
MIDQIPLLLLFVKDFTGRGADAFYWFQDGRLQETDAASVVSFQGPILCHDFWMIRDALFDSTGTLPGIIIDVDELRIAVSGIPEERLSREKRDVTAHLGQYGAAQEVCDAYQKIFNKGAPFDEAVAAKAATAIAAMYLDLRERASADGELERFFSVEVPVYRLLQHSMSAGISLDTAGLSKKRAQAEHDYFLALKDYSAKHDMPLETPSRRNIEAKLIKEGFELDEVSVEYLLEFVPHDRDFGGDTMALLALDTTRKVLGSLTLSTDGTRPMVDVFGSRTSRVQLRSPSLQNIPKRYRSIVAAHGDAKLCYVDFDQFEVGIMAALSGDEELKRLYAAGDMYELFATTYLGLRGARKAAKQLFLSYAYGMSRKALVDAAVSLGVDRQKAKEAFRRFQRYEEWKKEVWTEFQSGGRVTTILGNHYRRANKGQLTGKEQRSAVSQVVQGTASLIFKRTLLMVASIRDTRIVLPMHDALLFEHKLAETPGKVVEAFENVMTDVLGGRVAGKASIGDFAEYEPNSDAPKVNEV